MSACQMAQGAQGLELPLTNITGHKHGAGSEVEHLGHNTDSKPAEDKTSVSASSRPVGDDGGFPCALLYLAKSYCSSHW